MSQATIRSFWAAFFSALCIIFIGVLLIIIDTHSKQLTYFNGKEMLYRLLAGTQLLERSGNCETMTAIYEMRAYNPQSLSHDTSRPPPEDLSSVWLDPNAYPRTASIYSNVTKSYISLTELPRREDGFCPILAAGVGVGITLSYFAGLLSILIIGNYAAYHHRAVGALISYGAIIVTPVVMMLALLAITGQVQTQCERFQRGEELTSTVTFLIDLAGSMSSLPSQSPETVEAELIRLVNAVNSMYDGPDDRQLILFRGGAPSPNAFIAPPYSKINTATLRNYVNVGVSRPTFFIVDVPGFDGVLAKGYQPETGLWLALQEQMPQSSNQLTLPHLQPGLVVGLIGALVLSLISAVIFPFPSLGTTSSQRPGMTPTSDISSIWPVTKVISFGLIAAIVSVAVMSNLALSTRVTRYYGESLDAIRPLVDAYTDLQTISVNTAVIVANASLGQDWDSNNEVYPSFVNTTIKNTLIEEQQTIRSITADYIDRFGPLSVYRAGFGSTYTPFVQTTSVRGYLATLTNPSLVKEASIYINRAEFAFLTLLLTQNATFEAEMINWLNMISSRSIGAPGARSAVIAALTSLTAPLRSAVGQVSFTDARSQIARLSVAGAITNYTHRIYLEMLSSGADTVNVARAKMRATQQPQSAELCFYMIDVSSAIAVTTVIFLSLAVGLDSWYTPSFLARKRSQNVITVVFLVITACGLAIAAILGAAAALTTNVAHMSASVNEAQRLFEFVPRSLRLFDTSARSLAEWLLVLQSPTSISLNHAMTIDSMLRTVLQNFMEGVPDTSDPHVVFILDLVSDLGDALSSIFSVAGRDYRDVRTPLWDVADAMDDLYRTANSSILSDRAPLGWSGMCGCSTLEESASLTSTVLEMSRSVILRSVNLWTLPALYPCCTDAHAAINQLYRRAIVYMQVQAVDEGALTTTDMATIQMRAATIVTKMQSEMRALQNRIIVDVPYRSRTWLTGFWVPTVLVWGIAGIAIWVLKLTRLELNSATK